MLQNTPASVMLREVGPRDGLQIEPAFLPTETKKVFIRKLAEAGLPHIEVTSFVHPKWIPALADGKEIGKTFADLGATETSALVPNMKGFEGAREAGMKIVTVFMSATEGHNKANLNRTREQSLAEFAELIPTVKAAGVKVNASLSVVCGCPFEGEVEVAEVVRLAEELLRQGADTISLGDTIGVGNPLQVKRMLDALLPKVPPERLIVHFHDTQGMAVANALVSLEMGVRVFDGAVGGLGGCPYAPGASGNVPTENLVYLFEQLGVDTGVDLEALYAVAEWIQGELGHALPSGGLKAWLGRRARAAEQAEQQAARA